MAMICDRNFLHVSYDRMSGQVHIDIEMREKDSNNRYHCAWSFHHNDMVEHEIQYPLPDNILIGVQK